MSSFTLDPDYKVNMSLDDIIHLSKSTARCNSSGGTLRSIRKKKRPLKKNADDSRYDHSIPLKPSPNGGYIYVTRKSPLLSIANRRSIIQSVSNRVLNSELIEMKREIIPARYKIIKTPNGLERILVPAEKESVIRALKNSNNDNPNSSRSKTQPLDCPPPLITTPIYKYPSPSRDHRSLKMEVSEPEDDIIVLQSDKKQPPVIDVESNEQINSFDSMMTHARRDDLNKCFTFLTGNFQF